MQGGQHSSLGAGLGLAACRAGDLGCTVFVDPGGHHVGSLIVTAFLHVAEVEGPWPGCHIDNLGLAPQSTQPLTDG